MGFGGYGSGEINILILGGVVGFFVGLPKAGLIGGLIGAVIGSIGLFTAFLLLVFTVWAVGWVVIKIKEIGRKKNRNA